ncbi:MAG: TolC family protein [Gemmatimonadales bacterium]
MGRGLLAVLLALAVPPPVAVAQATDSLSLATFLGDVSRHHPVARQARLYADQAGAKQAGAVGALFDPKLGVSWARKAFAGSEYFNYLDAELKLPTPLGVDVFLGYERTRGRYFAQDRRTPDDGLLALGVSLPLGQGLITDRRRALAAEARGLRRAADAKRDAMINKLLGEAAGAWAGWRAAEAKLALARQGVDLAVFRAGAVRQRVIAGDAPPIDTVEVDLEVARRRTTLAYAIADRVAARERMGTLWWGEDGRPRDVPVALAPGDPGPLTPPDEDTLAGWLAAALRDHPDIRGAVAQRDAASATERQALVELLPDLEAKVARLADGSSDLGDFPAAGGAYKFELTAMTSLLLTKERAEASIAGARRAIAGLDVVDATRMVAAEITTAAAALVAAGEAQVQQARAVSFAERLREGEVRRFEAGDASLFLVNQRERTLLDEAAKLADAEAKAVSARAKLAVALGWPATLPD